MNSEKTKLVILNDSEGFYTWCNKTILARSFTIVQDDSYYFCELDKL